MDLIIRESPYLFRNGRADCNRNIIRQISERVLRKGFESQDRRSGGLLQYSSRDLAHMKSISGEIRLSASDLGNHLACHHLTSLDLAVSLDARSAPTRYSPDPRVLQECGTALEDAYLKHLEAQGVSILNLRDIKDFERPLAETRVAMESGANHITEVCDAA